MGVCRIVGAAREQGAGGGWISRRLRRGRKREKTGET
jgi:hypothetical protein